MTARFDYHRPASLEEAWRLAATIPGNRILLFWRCVTALTGGFSIINSQSLGR